MVINSGILTENGTCILGVNDIDVWVAEKDQHPHVLISGYHDIRFLTASPAGKYFAFWSTTENSFRLLALSGTPIWSARLYTDKAIPRNICFSQSSDTLICEYECEGFHGLFFTISKSNNNYLLSVRITPLGMMRIYIILRCIVMTLRSTRRGHVTGIT
jgi:hypothetical protein